MDYVKPKVRLKVDIQTNKPLNVEFRYASHVASRYKLTIDSLSLTLIMSLKHELYDLNYVLYLQKVPNREKPHKVESPF